MYCGQCGTEIAPNSAVCPSCGTPVATGMPPYQQPYGQPMYVTKPPVPGRGYGIASMVLGIVGLVYMSNVLMAAVDMLELFSDAQFPLTLLATLMLSTVTVAAFSILATVFGIVALKKGYSTGVSKSGCVTGVIGVALYAVYVIMCVLAII